MTFDHKKKPEASARPPTPFGLPVQRSVRLEPPKFDVEVAPPLAPVPAAPQAAPGVPFTLTNSRSAGAAVQRAQAQPVLTAARLLAADQASLQQAAGEVGSRRAALGASRAALAARELSPEPASALQRRTPPPAPPLPPVLPALQRQLLTESAGHDVTRAFTRDARYVPGAVRAELALNAVQRAVGQGADGAALHAHLEELAKTPHDREAVQRAVTLQRRQEAREAQGRENHALQVEHARLQRQLDEAVGREAEAGLGTVSGRVRARQGGGEPLPAAVQRHLEQGLNADLGRVRVHTDAEADGLARGVGAKAFTSGADIYFRRGLYDPSSREGLGLIAHEATHTVQQAQGKVSPGLDPDAGLEAEAQRMGERLAETKPGQAPDAGTPVTRGTHASPVHPLALQRLTDPSSPGAGGDRAWRSAHDFGGELLGDGVQLGLRVTGLQRRQGGVVTGNFSAPNGSGRLYGHMDPAGKVYWQARYTEGKLSGQTRQFTGRVTFKPGGMPLALAGQWVGQNAQKGKATYDLQATRQAPEPTPAPTPDTPKPDATTPESGAAGQTFPVPASLKLPNGQTVKLDPKMFSAQGSFATVTNTAPQPGSPAQFSPQPTGLVDTRTKAALAAAKGIPVSELQTARPWTATEFLAQGRDYANLNMSYRGRPDIMQVHTGWDLNTTRENQTGGSPVKAAADGVVWVDKFTGMGETVVIYHPQFRRYTRYGHLKSDSTQVKVGMIVKSGQQLAIIGNTNTASPHLHFDVIKKYESPEMWNGIVDRGSTQMDVTKYVMDHYEDPMLFFRRAGLKVPKAEGAL